MCNTFFFSVIINTYNNQKTIIGTLKSVINQTFRNFELIIVDDCSSDNTVNLVEKEIYTKKLERIKLIKLKQNKGISGARNVGIKEAVGNYIAFIDGDDIWKKNKLQVQYNYIKESNAEWLFSNYSVIDSNYNYLGERIRKAGIYDYRKIISRGNPVGMLTVVVESHILKSNLFRNIKHEDYDLWIRLSKRGIPGYLISESLASYMKHKNTVSSNKFQSILWTYTVFRTNKLPRTYSLFLMTKYILNYFMRKTRR